VTVSTMGIYHVRCAMKNHWFDTDDPNRNVCPECLRHASGGIYVGRAPHIHQHEVSNAEKPRKEKRSPK